MSNKNHKIYRHGDIILTLTGKEEKGEILPHDGSFVLARGEVTNHKHLLTVPDITKMEVRRLADGRIQLTLKEDGQLTHEEHKTLIVKKGTYTVGREQEYSYFELQSQRVVD